MIHSERAHEYRFIHSKLANEYRVINTEFFAYIIKILVRRLQDHVIEAEVVTGRQAGKRVYITRIPMNPADSNLPFTLRRLRFPVRVAFAMTINKAQGQTLSHVGLYLNTPVFCHGQLYVALSRVKRASGLRILLPQGDTTTTNVVYMRPP